MEQASCQRNARTVNIEDNVVNSNELFECCGFIKIIHNKKEFLLRLSDNGKKIVLKQSGI